jgi:hypothetical protein
VPMTTTIRVKPRPPGTTHKRVSNWSMGWSAMRIDYSGIHPSKNLAPAPRRPWPCRR